MIEPSDTDSGEFWSQFPDTETEFISQMRDPGIYATVDLEFSPKTRIQSEYGGVSTRKMTRRIKHWRDEGQIPEDVDQGAVSKFEADVKSWNEEYQVAVERAREKLPTPVFGCHWVSDMGGLIRTRKAGGRSVPDRLSFRLWRDDLGYMPQSE